ncbi:MAG: TatD family hydrolase [Phycisphaerales bacterium]|nr:MAG: TatD family hydrolase [Phycisphaerales bacterium]
MELIDTHAHLSFEPLALNVEGVLEASRAAHVTAWITVGTDLDHDRKCVALAERFDNLYAAVGIHPHDAKDINPNTMQELAALAQNLNVVAIGETGLDFHYNLSDPTDQKRAFAKQLQIARELHLPVVVHCREAFEQTVELLEQFGAGLRGVVFHCFSGSPQQAEIVLEHNWHISLTGVVTFKNAEKTRSIAKDLPIDRLMLETDCPYMSPEPVRKQKINEPALMVHTARFLAELKQITLEDLAERTTKTAKAFFHIP